MCVCSKAHGPYYIVICGLSVGMYNVNQHYNINVMIVGKGLLDINRVFWFPLLLLPETFRIVGIIEPDNINNVQSLHIN